MGKSVKILLVAGCILLIGLVVQAQTDCAVVVRQALLLVDDTCDVTGRNQACYGFLRVDAEARANAEAFSFEPGDIEDVTKIASLRTYPYDAETGEWGVSLIRLQANLPDLLPGANATFLMFGDAEIRDVPGENLRPMQAVRLRTGITGTSCQEVTSDGLLIQTPHGVGHVDFNINRVDVSLGSTAFLQAVPGDKMTLSTIEGSARVTLGGVTRLVLPGFRIEIPLDEDLNPIGSLGLPRPYIMETVETLPLELLDEPVVLRLPGGAELPPTIEDPSLATVSCCDETSTPGSGLIRPTSTPSANVQSDEDGRLGDMAGNSDNVFTGNCGNGQGVGVANGCNETSTSTSSSESSESSPPPNSNAGGNSDNSGNPPPNSNAGGNDGSNSNAQPAPNDPPPNSNAGGNGGGNGNSGNG